MTYRVTCFNDLTLFGEESKNRELHSYLSATIGSTRVALRAGA